jgi:hypothetical protein
MVELEIEKGKEQKKKKENTADQNCILLLHGEFLLLVCAIPPSKKRLTFKSPLQRELQRHFPPSCHPSSWDPGLAC